MCGVRAKRATGSARLRQGRCPRRLGRTPRVNNDAGRDHYPNVFSAALAGGPVKGGRVVGESDSRGAFPRANPKSPQDVLATMYRHLGIDTR